MKSRQLAQLCSFPRLTLSPPQTAIIGRSQMPHGLPPWLVVYQQTRRWIEAGVFEALVHDLRELIRIADKRNAQPSAMILDSRPLQSTPESGARRL